MDAKQIDMCFFSYASRLVFYIYGTLGPAYHTYKTLNNGDDEFLAWAKYWIVYAFLVSIELVTDAFLSWMTIYMPIKLFLMLWIVLTAPSANVWMFDAIVHPVLANRQERIDQFLNRGKYKLLNDSLGAVSQMCIHGRTFMRPLISQFWSKSNFSLGGRNNLVELEDLTGGGIVENAQDSDASTASVQTSRLNVCSRPSPNVSFTHINDPAEELQQKQSLNDLAKNTISPDPSGVLRRRVVRKGKQSKVPDTINSSQTNLTSPKKKLYDDVEDLLATTRIEPDGQDVRQHRQPGNRNRAAISQP